jgi:hypothetical protein
MAWTDPDAIDALRRCIERDMRAAIHAVRTQPPPPHGSAEAPHLVGRRGLEQVRSGGRARCHICMEWLDCTNVAV